MADGALLDVNVLVALVWSQHVHHGRAYRWFRGRSGPWCTTPVTGTALLRLSLNHSVSGTSISAAQALGLLVGLRQHPQHRFLPDDSSLIQPTINLARFAASRQVTDLHLVNLAVAHDLRLATLDHDIPEMLDPEDRRYVELLAAD